MNTRIKALFQVVPQTCGASGALLLLRLVCGVAFVLHGWGKIQNPFGWMGPDAQVPAIFQFLAALSEFGGGVAWILGLLTTLASFGMACTMAVAVVLHRFIMGDPFVNMTGGSSYELALVFFSVSVLFLLAGPGKLSLDAKIFGERK